MIDEKKYRIFVISMCVVLLMFGIYIGFSVEKKNNVANSAETVMNKEDDDNEVNIYDNKIVTKKYDIELVYEDYYTLCNETITNSQIIYQTTLDELIKSEKEKQSKENKEYSIKEKTNERLVFYRELEQNCPNHFNVKLEDGIIVIYSVVNESVSTVYKKIDISQDLIRPELVEELNLGIEINSKEELNLFIEDIES